MAQKAPSCPRCGYDQSGVVESWAAACPLSGVCSECGLRFDWLDVMRPQRLSVPGFYEHAEGVAPRAAWRTLVWTGRPRRFWSRIRLEHPLKLSRAVLWLMLILGVFQVLHVVSVVGERLWDSGQMNARIAKMNAQMAQMGPQGRSFAAAMLPGSAPSAWEGVVAECLEPIARREVVFYWWSRRLGGSAGGAAGGGSLSGIVPGWRGWPLFALGMVCFSLALPAMLLCLPQSRARAKVHLRHIARATVYGAAWLVLLAGVRLMGELWLWLKTTTGGGWPPPISAARAWRPMMQSGWQNDEIWQAVERHQLLAGAVLGLWLSWWWWCALKRGFRVEQPVAVWLAMVVPAALIALTVLSVVSPFGVGGFVDGLVRGRWLPR